MTNFYADPTLEDGFGSTAPWRSNPHRGLDFPHRWGTPIPSLNAGTVTLSEYSDWLGWVVEVAGDDGYHPGYRHQASQGLAVGTRVEVGDTIGRVGDTGSTADGAHLCLTIGTGPGAVYGVPGLVIDPWPYICSLTPPPPEKKEPRIMSTIYARATTNSSPTIPDDEGSSRIWAGDMRKAEGESGELFSGVWAIDTETGTTRRLTMAELRIVVGAYAAIGLPVPIAEVHGNDLQIMVYGSQVKK